jgi:hypothetical protein
MKRSRFLLQLVFVLSTIVFLISRQTPLYSQTEEKTTIDGQILIRGGVTTAWQKPTSQYTIYFTHKGCKCSDCKPKEKCRCCPPQFTTTTNGEGQFKASLDPGKYSMQVQVDEKSWKVFDVEVANPGQKKKLTFRIGEN